MVMHVSGWNIGKSSCPFRHMYSRLVAIIGKERYMLLAWIKNIVLFILFSSLVFFLLPDEKYRKYMQTAVGFVLAIIVLTPVLSAGLNDILSFDYYYESVAGAPGNGDVAYYTDVMETMIEDHLRDTFQLDSKVTITFDESYTVTAVKVDVVSTTSGSTTDTTMDAANLRQEIAKEYKISEDRIEIFVNGYQTK